MENKLEEVSKLLEETHQICEVYFESVIPADTDKQQSYSILLYSRIIQLAGAMLALSRTKHWFIVVSLYRPSIDAYVDLVNLLSDKNYHLSMKVKQLAQENKRMNGVIEHYDQIGSQVSIDDINRLIETNKSEIEQLKSQGGEDINSFQSYDKVGKAKVYRTLYSLLCSHIHNGMEVLEASLIQQKSEHIFTLYDQEKEKQLLSVMSHTATGLLSSSIELKKLFPEATTQIYIELIPKYLALDLIQEKDAQFILSVIGEQSG